MPGDLLTADPPRNLGEKQSAAGLDIWVAARTGSSPTGRELLRPQGISTRFEDLISKYGLVRHEPSIEGRPIHRIVTRYRTLFTQSRWPVGHCHRPGSTIRATGASLALRVISETLAKARRSSTPDAYTLVVV